MDISRNKLEILNFKNKMKFLEHEKIFFWEIHDFPKGSMSWKHLENWELLKIDNFLMMQKNQTFEFSTQDPEN